MSALCDCNTNRYIGAGVYTCSAGVHVVVADMHVYYGRFVFSLNVIYRCDTHGLCVHVSVCCVCLSVCVCVYKVLCMNIV